jgi:hypothetical protein
MDSKEQLAASELRRCSELVGATAHQWKAASSRGVIARQAAELAEECRRGRARCPIPNEEIGFGLSAKNNWENMIASLDSVARLGMRDYDTVLEMAFGTYCNSGDWLGLAPDTPAWNPYGIPPTR